MPPCLSVTQISPFFGNHMKNGTAAAVGDRLHILFLRQAVQAARAGVRGNGWLSRENVCFGRSGRDSAMDVQQLLEKAPAESRVVLGRGRMPGAPLVPEGKGTLPGH